MRLVLLTFLSASCVVAQAAPDRLFEERAEFFSVLFRRGIPDLVDRKIAVAELRETWASTMGAAVSSLSSIRTIGFFPAIFPG